MLSNVLARHDLTQSTARLVAILLVVGAVAPAGAIERRSGRRSGPAATFRCVNFALVDKTIAEGKSPWSDLLRRVEQRVIQPYTGRGGGVVFSADASSGNALVISANHVLGTLVAAGGKPIDPRKLSVEKLQAHAIAFTGADRVLRSTFCIHRPHVAPHKPQPAPSDYDETPPGEDFALLLMTAQKLESHEARKTIQAVNLRGTPGSTADLPPLAIRDPEPGEPIVIVGFPVATMTRGGAININGEKRFSVGKVMSEQQVRAIYSEDSDFPFDPKRDLLCTAPLLPGNSGGPAFDTKGNLVGICVRGNGTYGRILKASYIFSAFGAALAKMPRKEQQDLQTLLGKLL